MDFYSYSNLPIVHIRKYLALALSCTLLVCLINLLCMWDVISSIIAWNIISYFDFFPNVNVAAFREHSHPFSLVIIVLTIK